MKLKKIIGAAVAAALAVGCTGGGQGAPPDTAAPESNSSPESQTSSAPGSPVTLADPNISVIYWRSERSYLTEKARQPNLFDAVWETKPLFEERYGGKVNIEYVEWNGMLARMVELQSAGAAPDLIEVYDRVMHNMIFQGAVMPLTDYVTDADFGFWDVDRDLFSWKGVPYAIPWKPYLTALMFNRDLIDLYGLEMPDELYKRGEWTFDKFREIVLATTRYVDGEASTLGFGSWVGDGMSRFLVANGSAFIDVDTAAGTASSGFDNQRLINTLDWMRSWGGGAMPGWVTDADMFGYFDNGGLALIDGKEYGTGEYPFEVGMVPYPKGPDSPVEKPVVVMPQGMAVPAGAKNPEGAVEFMRMLNQLWYEKGNSMEAAIIGQDYYDMIYNDPGSKCVYAFDKAVSNIDQVTGTIKNYLGDEVPASTIAETLNPELKAAIELVYGGQ
ncbi:MAG: extracellular solute-binding protein [Clostridiales bacterium]|jgi:multiple sugar transport system substrate-binding protein|nr:extracellular solute-binding protein [Clostridiales bacterium]